MRAPRAVGKQGPDPRFDSLGCSLLDAWTRRFGVAIKKLDLAQWLGWIVPGPVFKIGSIRLGKNRHHQA
jgi:hypothetical protein